MGTDNSKFTLKKAFYLVQSSYRNNYLLLISIGILPMLLWGLLDNSISVVQENYNFSVEKGMVEKGDDGFDGDGGFDSGILPVLLVGMAWLIATGISTIFLIKVSLLSIGGNKVKLVEVVPSVLEVLKYLALTLVIGLGIVAGNFLGGVAIGIWLYITSFATFFLLSGAGVVKSIRESVHMVRIDYFPMLRVMIIVLGMSWVFSMEMPWWSSPVWVPIGWLFMATLFKYHTYNKQRMLDLGVKDEPDEF